MNKLVLLWFRHSRTVAPSPKVLRWTNWIVVALSLLFSADAAPSLFHHWTAQGFAAPAAAGMVLLGALIILVTFGIQAVLILWIAYGPVLSIALGIRAVYYGFVPACKSTWAALKTVWAAVKKVPAAIGAACSGIVRLFTSAAAAIGRMTARDWVSTFAIVTSFIWLALIMYFVWPAGAWLVAKSPTWMFNDWFERLAFTIWFNLIIAMIPWSVLAGCWMTAVAHATKNWIGPNGTEP
jgi:hypothetical protein